MSLFLVTALPGTGKSTVYTELRARGFEAYDMDQDQLAKWYNNKTGIPVEGSHARTAEFLQNHSRNISRQLVEDLAAKAVNKPIFLCGDPENEDELHDLFTQTFALVVDEKTRLYRLATRTNSVWGKLPHEIARDLANKPIVEERYQRFNHTILNASLPVARVVDQIIRVIETR